MGSANRREDWEEGDSKRTRRRRHTHTQMREARHTKAEAEAGGARKDIHAHITGTFKTRNETQTEGTDSKERLNGTEHGTTQGGGRPTVVAAASASASSRTASALAVSACMQHTHTGSVKVGCWGSPIRHRHRTHLSNPPRFHLLSPGALEGAGITHGGIHAHTCVSRREGLMGRTHRGGCCLLFGLPAGSLRPRSFGLHTDQTCKKGLTNK